MKKRILSMVLAIVMLAGMLPAPAFAAEGDNLCDHHTEHTADCGYAPAVEGSPCNHTHDDTCGYIEAVEGVPCACVAAEDGTLTHAEGCGYVEAVEGSPCGHVHDEVCGYAEATEEQPCTYECADCAAASQEPSEEPSDTPVEPAESYTLTIEQGEGGTITADVYSWTEPTEITFTLSPEEGYTFVSAEIYGGTDQIGWLNPESFTDGTCTYSVLGSDVTVQNIVFEQNTTEPDKPAAAATRVIYVDESTFLASGYSRFYDANVNLLTTTREEQEDGWVKYTMPADAKYYLTFDGHLGGGGGDSYPQLPTNADTYDPSSDIWSCSHPGYAEGNCRLCGVPCPGHTYDNACDAECNVCSEIREVGDHVYDNACDASCNNCDDIREVGDHVYDGAQDAECNECGYVRDIAPVQITGISITVDGETYTSGNVTITPDSTVILTVTGTNLHNGSDDHRVDYASGVYQPVTPDYFEISEDGTVATYEPSAGDFAKSSNFEITYCNNDTDTANRTVVPTGIYLTYDDGIAEEDRARITGMSITIDGVVYDSSNTSAEEPAVITPNTEFITITVHGTALQNCTTDHVISYYSGSSQPILPDYLWHFEADGTGAYHYYSSASALSDFANNTTPYELQYSNNGSFNAANPAIGSGVYIVYDDSTGGEEDTTPAEITGVSITIDGVVYDSSNTSAEDPAVVTPTSTVTLTVTGTNLQNGTDDNRVDYAYGMYQSVEPDCCEISEDGTIATYTPPVKFFVNSSNYEIKYYNNYTDTANRTAVSTGIYLTYVRPVPDSDGKIVVDMKDQYSDGWNGAAIEIYKNGTLEETATVDDGVFFNTASVDYDSTASYEFKWVQGSYDSECSFTIYVDGEEKLKVSDASVYENGETIWPQGDTGGEEGGDDTIGGEEDTTPAEITGVSITVDGVPYTSGNVTITPTSTIIYTVTGTNFANLSADNVVSYASGSLDTLHNGGWTIDTETNTATRDFSDSISWFDACDNYEVRYSNDGDVGSAYVGTGIYLTYDDTTGGEEDTTPAEITGVSITVDGVTYTEGDVTITPETESIIVTVTGNNFAKLSADHELDLGPGLTIFMNSFRWEIDSDANTATADLSDLNSEFVDHKDYEITYSNGGGQGLTGTGIYLTYDDGTGGEEDTTPAEITGVSITVDGVTYTEGDVTITPTSTIIVTVTGTNFANLSGDHELDLGSGLTIFMNSFRWKIDSAANTATADFSDLNSEFGDHKDYEIMYSNGGGQGLTGTGIYLTYDDGTGGGEDTTPAQITGVSITVDGVTYTEGDVTITPTSTIIVTVTGTNFANLSAANILDLGPGLTIFMNSWRWEIDPDANTATADFSDLNSEFGDHNGTEITYSNDSNQNWTGTGIYLTYNDGTGGEEDTTPAQITGVSITVDGETYTKGNVTITPDTQSIIVTVTGTHFANLSDANILDLGPGLTVFMDTWRWETDPAANTATADFSDLNPEFGDHNGSEITYSNDSNQNWTGTGIYLTYDDGTGGEEDTTPAEITGVSVVIDGEEYVGSDTSAENPAVITSEAASVILTVHGTNLQNATSDYLVVFGPAGNSVGLGGAQWTMSEDGSRASYDMTWLVEEFTESLPTWEIKYSTNGEDLEDAVTGLYVKYEHISEEEEPIVIIQQPTDGEAKLGERYCVEVIAQGEGLKYQWYFRNAGASSFSKSSVTDSTYDDVMTKARMNRQVYCVITDSHGNSVTTDTASLIALKSVDLAITKEPENVTANYGERFTVTAEAVGDGVTYEWYYLDPDGAAWLSTNVRSATYSGKMSEKIDGRAVYCVVRDIWGEQVATNSVRLCCERAELAITTQPNDASAKLNEEFCVTVEAQGDGLKYQWYFKNAGSDVWHKSSVRDNTYDDVMTRARHNREVYCVITDAWGDSVTTEIATITGTATVELAITRQPEDQTVPLGDPFCVTVEAVGDDLRYQWYFQNANAERFSVSGQRDNTYDDVMTAARHNRHLYCVITDAWGHSVTTDPVVVIMATQKHELQILQQPTNASAKLGENFCVTVEAQGDELRYQWYWRNAGSETWNVSGQRDNTYDDVMTKARHNREVFCRITDMWGNSLETNVATITAIPTAKLEITKQPTDGTAAMGENYCVTVEAVGDGLRYQWYFKNAGSDVWHKSSVRDNTYDDVMTKARAGREVKCVITDIWGSSVTTDTVTLIAQNGPVMITAG